ncbi:MAG TPA: TlpA disulfide reductase family protein [Thermoanaerobaculia bacterium]|nr:TlpA disulfide reductase family protein [Thermoanaerobaculia bacterium]
MADGRLLRAVALGTLLVLGTSSAPGAADLRPSAAKRKSSVLIPVSFDAWIRLLASLHGDVVVVDLWATWCAPCVERFPRMVDLARRYTGRGVRFVSLSLDDRSDAEALAWARHFLSAQTTPFPSYLLDEPLGSGFDRLELQGIPAVFLYDRAGALRFRLTSDDPRDQVTEKRVEGAIRRLLAECKH